MQNKIVFDLETKKAFDDVAGRDATLLGVSIVVAYDYRDNQFKSFREHELKNLWPLFENADLIIGFNHKSFDNKVLSAYYPGNLSHFPHLDLLEEFYKAAGFRVRLNDLAQATLGEQKSGHGLQAIRWFQEGNFEALEHYCRQDVKVTRDLYEYALQNNVWRYTELNEEKEIPIDVSAWGTQTIRQVNYTLPF